VDAIAKRAPFGPGQGAHVQLVVAHGSGLRGNLQTTPVGGHSYLADAQPTTDDPGAEYGATAVWEGGAAPAVGGRGRTVRHQTGSATHGGPVDPDHMAGGVHPLPAGTALPVAPPLPVPVPVLPVPVDPAALGLPADLVAAK
jgi:hypothetical protein